MAIFEEGSERSENGLMSLSIIRWTFSEIPAKILDKSGNEVIISIV